MAKVKLDIIAKATGQAALKGLTGKLTAAALAVEAIKIATKALINVTKASIEAFAAQELAERKLEQQTGGNIDANKEFASSIQEVTTVGDEAVLQLQQMGLAMGVAEENIEDASKGAIGLSKAFGIDLNTAMKLVANATSGNTSALTRYIPELKTVKSETERMAIVQKKMAEGFDLAKAEADTFTGRMKQLKNAQGDVLESVGRIVSVFGKDFVENSLKATEAMNGFLNNSQGIAKAAGGFEVFKAVVSDISKNVFGELKKSLGLILKPFKGLFNGIKINIDAFSVIGKAVEGLSIGLRILIKIQTFVIKLFSDVQAVVLQTARVLAEFVRALIDPTKWGDAKKQIESLKDSFLELTAGTITNIKDMVIETKKEFENFSTNAEKAADKYSKIWKDKTEEVKKELEGAGKDIPEIIGDWGDEINKETKDDLDKNKVTWQNWADGIMNIVTQTMSIIQEARDNFFDSQFNSLSESLDSEQAKIDEAAQREIEARGVQQATKQEMIAQDIEALRERLAEEDDAQEQARIRDEIREKQKESARIQILLNANKEKEKAAKKAAQKEKKLKEQQVKENKAFAIANVWINAAQAVMGFWAAYAGIPFAGPIIAGVLTAGALTLAGVQTGLIASQGFEEGGVIPGNSLTGDRVAIRANSAERVLTAEQNRGFEEMVFGGGGGDIVIQNMTVVTDSPENFRDQMIEVKRFELGRT